MINNCLNSPLPLPTLASPLKTKQPLSFTVLNPLTFFIIFTNYTERSFLRRSFCHFHLQILIYSEIEVQGLESFSNKMMLKSKYSSIHNLWTIVTSLFSTIAINIYLMFQPNICDLFPRAFLLLLIINEETLALPLIEFDAHPNISYYIDNWKRRNVKYLKYVIQYLHCPHFLFQF